MGQPTGSAVTVPATLDSLGLGTSAGLGRLLALGRPGSFLRRLDRDACIKSEICLLAPLGNEGQDAGDRAHGLPPKMSH